MEEFLVSLAAAADDDALLDFYRRQGVTAHWRSPTEMKISTIKFRKQPANKFRIDFREVFIISSAKLGFSPHKKKPFNYDSAELYDRITLFSHNYQIKLREHRKAVSDKALKGYHKFREYGAIGWLCLDLLPILFRINELKRELFGFFGSVFHDKSEVGNYGTWHGTASCVRLGCSNTRLTTRWAALCAAHRVAVEQRLTHGAKRRPSTVRAAPRCARLRPCDRSVSLRDTPLSRGAAQLRPVRQKIGAGLARALTV